MPKKKDLVGNRYGRLVVVEETERPSKYVRQFRCLCDCSNETLVRYANITSGNTTSCGCEQKRRAAEANTKHGYSSQRRRGVRRGYQYRAWESAKQRCFNPSNKKYPQYGGRGITMHEPWVNNSTAFIKWMNETLGPRPEGHSLDRINVHGNYEPNNLRWADASTQVSNQQRNYK